MILVDTSVLIDFLKGRKNQFSQKFKTVLQQGIPFGITPFIYQEVLQGAKSEREYELLKKYLETQRFYHPKHPLDSFAKAANIYFQCRRSGVTIRSTIDCIIAQTAIEQDLFLLHNDSDFDAMARVVGLKIY
jgi:predicted nucleic acid-binding protein